MGGSLNNASVVAGLTINHPPEELPGDLFIIMLLNIGSLILFDCKLNGCAVPRKSVCIYLLDQFEMFQLCKTLDYLTDVCHKICVASNCF